MEKNKGGRPLIYETEEELEKVIQEYYEECKNHKKEVLSKSGEPVLISSPKIPTIAGLAYSIGVDRGTIYNYEHKDQFFNTIKKHRDYILYQLEDQMMNSDGNVTGKIFLAKNYGYTDKQEIDSNININFSEQANKIRDIVNE